MIRRCAILVFASLFSPGAWAGGSIHGNPTPLHPRVQNVAVQPVRVRPILTRAGRSAAPPVQSTPRPVQILTPRGVIPDQAR